ncbi:MAG: bifunctional 4-hydroxy-2-oxoglutarate aldolase/2-dehydro-3-deoxy-phosphogluconate aldolase [Bacteroidales bacterium]|nr:bifunctional 4-hydroxy-2-oxoglutarate aldolase/2-dehydro-3-deoxy-phosphogluconate aldolase [Candidatus Cryptobacteroides aphodequi]
MDNRYSKKQIIAAIEETAVIPVFYNADLETSKNVLRACYKGGIRVFEFTNRGEAAAEVFRQLVPFVEEELPEMILGVGSISFVKDAWKFIRMGARFVVGPQFVPGIAPVCGLFNVPYMPGCGTVSEVGRAQRAGCEVCKVFPGDVLGPKFVKGLRAPMPWSKIMVTGGVKPERENLEAWFKAGVSCVGMGSNLFPKDVIEAGDWEKISRLCANTIAIIKEVR